MCHAVDICPDDLCASKMGWQWTPCPLYSSPSIPAWFIFFSHHADICIFYFNFLFESDSENLLTLLFQKVVHTCLYQDVHRCETNQWFDTNVALFNPAFSCYPWWQKQISTETLSSKWTPISWFLSLSLPAFSTSGPLFRGWVVVVFVPTLPADGTWLNNVSWLGSTMAANLYLSQKWHQCLR